MEIFISEFVCGGGWPESNVPESLAAEGGAMLCALCEDCARLPDVQVVTTRDVRRPVSLPASVRVDEVESANEEWATFLESAVAADASIIIAPELDDVLTSRVRAAREAGANVLAPLTDVVELCSDKLRLAQFLQQQTIRTIPTVALTQEASLPPWEGPLVVKPRFGAGSQGLVTVDATNVQTLLAPDSTPATAQRIAQPLIEGRAYSVGAFCHPADGRSNAAPDVLPLAQQLLLPDGSFQYLGGLTPAWAEGNAEAAMILIAEACCSLLPGLAGYVGFDFVVLDDAPDEPLLVEINPRLCTSYLGYRALTEKNLAQRMLNCGPHARLEALRTVSYSPSGKIHVIPLPETKTCA